MQTAVNIHRRRLGSSWLISTLLVFALCMLMSLLSSVASYADDTATDVDPADIGAALLRPEVPESEETDPEEPSTSIDVATPEIVDEADEKTGDEAINGLADGEAFDSFEDTALADEIGPEVAAESVTDVVEMTGTVVAEFPPVSDSESEIRLDDVNTIEGNAVEDNAVEDNASDLEVPENAAAQAESLQVAAWRLLEPPYSSESPLPVSGKAMYYNPGVMERVLENRLKFDRVDPCEQCIGRVAMLRFGDINRKVWLQFYGSHLEGPYHVIDTAATQHVGMLLDRDWILDVDYQTAQRWGMRMPYVTIWEDPPLELLMANFAVPLNWDASMSPASVFSTSLQSTDRVIAGRSDGYRAIKKSLNLQHRDVDSYVDLLSDFPPELYVK